MASLQPLTALGKREATTVTHGPLTISERSEVALASVAARKGRAQDLSAAAQKAGVPLPGPASYQPGTPYSAFWVAPEMWFVEAPYATHELVADMLKSALGDAASITEQTDAWVAFDLSADDLTPLLERLCNADYATRPTGYATRTVMEHLGVYLIKHGPGAARLYGPRSSAESLLHALETAAHSVW
ncbi:sarcosine oxidase subunit gamma [Tabrizicola sp.]|uniref:sarcosine oxidase subunit gamma n=1 Tax=Tabrizicola sp. TaxID=2005166 RepID=UPI0035B4C168